MNRGLEARSAVTTKDSILPIGPILDDPIRRIDADSAVLAVVDAIEAFVEGD